ncbi:hypothetical protein T10_7323 [Trichinella papuae]|uniref:Uncharacterized protein n=1 Tax=Trichinella papuae TaxID=268474 RepID=A0A0V1MG20_9BILA|nr:hypothetical protein T10_7323 [Trichinella papuae]
MELNESKRFRQSSRWRIPCDCPSYLLHSYLYLFLDLTPRLATWIIEKSLQNWLGCAIPQTVQLSRSMDRRAVSYISL